MWLASPAASVGDVRCADGHVGECNRQIDCDIRSDDKCVTAGRETRKFADQQIPHEPVSEISGGNQWI